jgi:outer membrane lipase/esterase
MSSANIWITVDANYLRVKNARGFPSVCAVPFGGTIGVDYRTRHGVVVGAALTVGSQKQKFTKIGGHFDQVVEAPSLYAAYKNGFVWCDVMATYGAFQNRIKRRVPLGIFTDENRASSNGYSLALMPSVGGDFRTKHITTGPLASVVLQHAHVRSFAESGTSGATALSFAGLTRNSIVSQLGWRLLGNIDKWQPFALVRWNHECGSKHKMVTASLMSVAAPSYTMAATPVASDWADAWLGTAYQINKHVMLRGAFTTTFLNRRVESYGGELSLNVNF